MNMPTFEDREKEFEARFKHDEELRFKVTARRNRLIGLWAAEKMGLSGDAANTYAGSIVDAVFAGGDPRVVEKLVADLAAKGQNVTVDQIKFELDHFAATAKQQVISG
jgi:hypothetical protein